MDWAAAVPLPIQIATEAARNVRNELFFCLVSAPKSRPQRVCRSLVIGKIYLLAKALIMPPNANYGLIERYGFSFSY